MNQLAKAIALASQVFENKTDKAGKPYILHCLWVMNGVDQMYAIASSAISTKSTNTSVAYL